MGGRTSNVQVQCNGAGNLPIAFNIDLVASLSSQGRPLSLSALVQDKMVIRLLRYADDIECMGCDINACSSAEDAAVLLRITALLAYDRIVSI